MKIEFLDLLKIIIDQIFHNKCKILGYPIFKQNIIIVR